MSERQKTIRERVETAQALVRRYVADDVSLVDELLIERRGESQSRLNESRARSPHSARSPDEN